MFLDEKSEHDKPYRIANMFVWQPCVSVMYSNCEFNDSWGTCYKYLKIFTTKYAKISLRLIQSSEKTFKCTKCEQNLIRNNIYLQKSIDISSLLRAWTRKLILIFNLQLMILNPKELKSTWWMPCWHQTWANI